MGDRDIWANALLLIDRHGDDAAGYALKRADEQLESGDIALAAVWARIMAVIREIEASGSGGPIH